MTTLVINKIPLGLYKANCYILREDNEVLIIDPGFHPQKIIEAIGDMNVVGIILTHGHIDHITAASALYEYYGKPIFIHDSDRELLYTRRRIPSAYRIAFTAPVEPLSCPRCQIGHFDLEIIEAPGHSPGSIIISYQGHWFTGDVLFKGTVGRTETYMGSACAMKKTLAYLRTIRENYHIHPGHGPDTTLQEELRHNPGLCF